MKHPLVVFAALCVGIALGALYSSRRSIKPVPGVLDVKGVCFSVSDAAEVEYLSKFDIILSDVVDKYKAVIILQAFYEEVRSIKFGGISCVGIANAHSSLVNDANQRLLMPARVAGSQLARDSMLLLRMSGDEEYTVRWFRSKFLHCAMLVQYDLDPLTPKIYRVGSIAYDENELVLNQSNWHEYVGVNLLAPEGQYKTEVGHGPDLENHP